MATTNVVPLATYMQTNYHPDREYVDGEVLERNVGKNEHSRVQNLLAAWFVEHEELWGLASFTEQRVQVSATRVRIPDVLLVPIRPHPEVFTEPPVLVVEILSPDDTYTDTQTRAEDYLKMGVQTVWIIDPGSRTGRCCINNTWTQYTRLEVPGTMVYVDLALLFDKMLRTSPR